MSTHLKSALISIAGVALTFATDFLVPNLLESYPMAAPLITAGFAWLTNMAYKNGWLGGLVKPTPGPVPTPSPVPVVPIPTPPPGPEQKNELLKVIAGLILDRLMKRDTKGVEQALEMYERIADETEA